MVEEAVDVIGLASESADIGRWQDRQWKVTIDLLREMQRVALTCWAAGR